MLHIEGPPLEALRSEIRAQKQCDEQMLVEKLLTLSSLTVADRTAIETRAVHFVEQSRARSDKQPLLDAFLQEYGLSNEEGIALMCLAEALLRVPDSQTRDDLIADKIAPGKWFSHAGKAGSVFVNASTWGLMLTGRIISLGPDITEESGGWLGKLTHRVGEPIIRTAMVQAMRIMGGEFVLGRTITEAASRGVKAFGPQQIYSFDMLGEGARTAADAACYAVAYSDAIKATGALAVGDTVYDRSGVSVKLSALHPRYEFANRTAVLAELGHTLGQLAELAAAHNVKMSIDAEEADRLDLSLDLFEQLALNPALQEWEGLGLVVQAYGKRALEVIEWLDALAQKTGRKFMVRLVKGAYWDTEIKHAQEQGLEGFPVFTR
ncbi:MAG: proline dehydrogenase family protein, partial [Kordiimonadaceae bacterium]|nr:proline dehydrogenase family protein [Kordiimonadaceae bacterium]